ncbi:hypothetical protein PV04_08247 [Phialophora macrospora]|uniref:Uncharacterized protein n=1 Tax=Phialophora macrospora TaxID=1851006 RepID=A0A0D2FDE9_9EURO|nr:hypothetical protein PV04_08247 [Phialophora macrospora]
MAYLKQVSALVTVAELSHSPPQETAPLKRKETFPSLAPARIHVESIGNPSIGGRKMPGQSQIASNALAAPPASRRRRIIRQIGNNTTGANVIFGGNQVFNNSSPRYAARAPALPEASRRSRDDERRQRQDQQEQADRHDREETRDNRAETDSAIGDIDPNDDDSVDGPVDGADAGADDGADDGAADIFEQIGHNSRGTNVLFGGEQLYNGSTPVFYS